MEEQHQHQHQGGGTEERRQSTEEPERPLFSFGVISDVQYADRENGRSFHGISRHYRHALLALREAVTTWNEINEREGENTISFVVNLGDIIDGQAKDQTEAQLDRVLAEFHKFNGGPVYHLLGNHCLYNLTREQLHPKLGLEPDVAYYEFSPHEKFRFVVIDPYDVSMMGWPKGHPSRLAAEQILKQHNPNTELNSPEGMRGRKRRYVAFNGAVGEVQLKWLDTVLEDASNKGQIVILCSHVPIYPHNSTAYAFLWNYEEVMAIIKKYNCVKVVLAGHDHSGGYTHHHAHHYIFKGVVECEPGTNAFSRMDVYEDRILMKGFGGIADMTFYYQHGQVPPKIKRTNPSAGKRKHHPTSHS